MERLGILIQRRSWEDVLQLCRNLLQGSSSHYAPLYDALLMRPRRNSNSKSNNTGGILEVSLETHQRDLVAILHSYIRALIQLGRHHDLVLEMERWSFCHHNDRSAPDWIPWSLHIAAASALQFIPQPPNHAATRSGSGGGEHDRDARAQQLQAHHASLDALWAIRSDILPQYEATAVMQVENAIANVFTAMKEWRMVLLCYQRMMMAEPLSIVAREEALRVIRRLQLSADADVVARAMEWTYRTELLSRQGRVLLQAGASDAAKEIFAQAARMFHETFDASSKDILSDHAAVQLLPAQLTTNDGLYQFSLGQYDQATIHFQATVDYLRSTETTTPAHVPPSQTMMMMDFDAIPLTTTSRENLYSECTNNLALAALYTCRLSDALQLLESLIQENVTAHLTPRVALNVCTLYELASEAAASARKKRVLQKVAQRFALHDIPAEHFRVNN